jgi:hypothetical protein
MHVHLAQWLAGEQVGSAPSHDTFLLGSLVLERKQQEGDEKEKIAHTNWRETVQVPASIVSANC